MSEFNLNKTRKDGLQARCRVCTRREVKKHYNNNLAYYTRKAKRRNIVIRNDLRRKIEAYFLFNPCLDCGESDIRCLTFDHVRGNKTQNISDMVRNCHSWESILDEISKCDVRCANCHMKRTSVQFNWWSATKVL